MLTARGVWKASILRCSSSRVSSSARFLHRRHSHRVTRRHSAVRLQQARRRAPGRFLEDELAKGGPKVLRVDAGARRNVALHEPHELVVDLEAALVDHYGHEADGHAARAHPLAGLSGRERAQRAPRHGKDRAEVHCVQCTRVRGS